MLGAEGVSILYLHKQCLGTDRPLALTIGSTPYWLRLQHIDGYIVVHTHAVSSPTWVMLGSVRRILPYSSDLSSHGALFMENATGGSTCPLHDDTMTLIPF